MTMWITNLASSILILSSRGDNIMPQKRIILLIILAALIVPKNCEVIPVLNKCCPDGTLLNDEIGECVQINVEKVISSSDNGSNQVYNNKTDLSLLNLPRNLVLFITDRNSSVPFQFKLEHDIDVPTCINASFIVQIKLNILSNNKTDNETDFDSRFKVVRNDDSLDSFTLTSIPMFTVSGQLKLQRTYLGANSIEYFSKPEYCIAGLADDILSIRVCDPTCKGNTPCIRKCCDLDEVWNQRKGRGPQKCAPAGEHHWSPDFYKDAKTKASASEVAALYPHYKIVHPRYWCNVSVWRPTSIEQNDQMGRSHIKFRITTNGGLLLKNNRYDWNNTEFDSSYYCYDGRFNAKYLHSSVPNQTEYSGNNQFDTTVFDCGPPIPKEMDRGYTTLYGVAMICSCFFLLIMIIVYSLLFEKQRVHGWTIMSYATSLFFMYLCFILTYFSRNQFTRQRSGSAGPACYALGVALHFFFLSTFSWISMVNFDLWSTFRNLKPTSGRSKGLRRYLVYALFSFGLPITIVSVALSLDSTYGDDFDSGVVVPEYGRRTCMLDQAYAQLFYAYGPAGILLAFNLVFFTITIYSMYKIQQSTKFATSSSSKNEQQKQSRWPNVLIRHFSYNIRLFAKLLFVMGIPWIFEIISWALEHNKKTKVPFYWTFFDLINCLQAVAIFYIFVCKRDIIHSLEQKYPKFKNFLNSVLLDPEKSDRIIKTYPKLKGLVKPITRRQMEQTSAARNTETSSYHSSSRYHSTVRRPDKNEFSMSSQPTVD